MNAILKAYRQMLGITQEEMANKLGLLRASYSHRECGRVEFTQEEMQAITNIFKEHIPEITLDEIFFTKQVIKLKTIANK